MHQDIMRPTLECPGGRATRTRALIALMFMVSVTVTAVASARPLGLASGERPSRDLPVEVVAAPDLLASQAKAEEPSSSPYGRPYTFAERVPVALSSASAGAWETTADGTIIWRLRLRSTGARSLNLHFDRFALPTDASLWIYNAAGDHVQGPYTAADQNVDGELWTALVLGEEVVVEIDVPEAQAGEVDVALAAVNYGFRDLPRKQGSCNNDVVCPEGDGYREQISAVVRLSLGGVSLCSGQLVNNTNDDGRPLLLSAYHCILDNANVPDFSLIPSTVTYFNFESPICGALSGGSLTQTVSGAQFRAGDQTTDFLLTELNQAPPAAFGAYLAGWNASGTDPSGAVGIHHPSADEKAISFDNDPLTTDVEFFPGGTHWRIGEWEDGTTERGSSGSCIFDPADGLCVGTLTGGFAACSQAPGERTEDYYGKISAAFEGGGTRETRLREWLDPAGTGVDRLAGRAAGDDGGPGDGCVPTDTRLCLLDGRFAIEAEFRTFDDRRDEARSSSQSTSDSALFYFFNDRNLEILVKMINGCTNNDHFWVFAAATTNLEYTLRVTDTVRGVTTTYQNPLGVASPAITDTRALATCP